MRWVARSVPSRPHRDHHVADIATEMGLRIFRDRLVLDRHLAVEVRLDERLLVDLRRAADVERPHRQLGAGSRSTARDDADRFNRG